MRDSSDNAIRSSPYAPAYIVVAIALIGSAFFIAEHQPDISTRPDFVAEIDEQESWVAGGNRLRQAGFVALAMFGAFGLVFGAKERFQWNAIMVFALAYVAWAGASILWSIDPGTSARRYIVMLCCAVGALGIGRLLTARQIVVVAIAVLAGYLCLGVGAELALGTFRPHVADYRFAGTAHPNTQGAYLALLCLACSTMALASPQHRFWCGLVLATAFAFLLLTKSRTACAALSLALVAMWVAASSSARTAYVSAGAAWVLSVAAVLVMAAGFDPVGEYADVMLMGRQDEAASLTGRIPLWRDLWTYGQQRPWTGYGYAAFWNPRHIYEISASQEWAISEAHSSYVGSFLQVGIIGVVLLVLAAISGVARSASIYRRTRGTTSLFLVGGLVFCLLRGLTESGTGSPAAITIFLAAGLARASFVSCSRPPERNGKK